MGQKIEKKNIERRKKSIEQNKLLIKKKINIVVGNLLGPQPFTKYLLFCADFVSTSHDGSYVVENHLLSSVAVEYHSWAAMDQVRSREDCGHYGWTPAADHSQVEQRLVPLLTALHFLMSFRFALPANAGHFRAEVLFFCPIIVGPPKLRRPFAFAFLTSSTPGRRISLFVR